MVTVKRRTIKAQRLAGVKITDISEGTSIKTLTDPTTGAKTRTVRFLGGGGSGPRPISAPAAITLVEEAEAIAPVPIPTPEPIQLPTPVTRARPILEELRGARGPISESQRVRLEEGGILLSRQLGAAAFLEGSAFGITPPGVAPRTPFQISSQAFPGDVQERLIESQIVFGLSPGVTSTFGSATELGTARRRRRDIEEVVGATLSQRRAARITGERFALDPEAFRGRTGFREITTDTGTRFELGSEFFQELPGSKRLQEFDITPAPRPSVGKAIAGQFGLGFGTIAGPSAELTLGGARVRGFTRPEFVGQAVGGGKLGLSFAEAAPLLLPFQRAGTAAELRRGPRLDLVGDPESFLGRIRAAPIGEEEIRGGLAVATPLIAAGGVRAAGFKTRVGQVGFETAGKELAFELAPIRPAQRVFVTPVELGRGGELRVGGREARLRITRGAETRIGDITARQFTARTRPIRLGLEGDIRLPGIGVRETSLIGPRGGVATTRLRVPTLDIATFRPGVVQQTFVTRLGAGIPLGQASILGRPIGPGGISFTRTTPIRFREGDFAIFQRVGGAERLLPGQTRLVGGIARGVRITQGPLGDFPRSDVLIRGLRPTASGVPRAVAVRPIITGRLFRFTPPTRGLAGAGTRILGTGRGVRPVFSFPDAPTAQATVPALRLFSGTAAGTSGALASFQTPSFALRTGSTTAALLGTQLSVGQRQRPQAITIPQFKPLQQFRQQAITVPAQIPISGAAARSALITAPAITTTTATAPILVAAPVLTTTITPLPFVAPSTPIQSGFAIGIPALPTLGGGPGGRRAKTPKRGFFRTPSFAAVQLGIFATEPSPLEFTGLVERPRLKKKKRKGRRKSK